MSQVLDEAQAAQAVDALRAQGKRVVFSNGAFDLLHVGHVRALQAAAAHGEVLVVGVNGDAHVRRTRGGGRPIVPAAERAELVAALACVDLVFVFEGSTVDALLERLRPDVHAKGRDYDATTLPERATNERLGIEMVFVGDPKDHASTDLVARAARTEALRDKIVPLDDPDVRGFVSGGRKASLAARGLLSLHHLVTGKVGTFVEGPAHRFVRRVNCDGTPLYVKVTRPLTRGRSPIVEFQHHIALRSAGILAPEPWLCLEGDVDGERVGVLCTAQAPGVPLDRFAETCEDPTARRLAADDVGRAIRGLHTARFLHPDLQAWHLTVGPGGSVGFLDLMRVSRAGKRVPRTPAARALAALMLSLERSATAREHLRTLRAYLGGTLRAGRSWMRSIDRQAQRLRTKSTFRQVAAP